jgi:hypothetical protein
VEFAAPLVTTLVLAIEAAIGGLEEPRLAVATDKKAGRDVGLS